MNFLPLQIDAPRSRRRRGLPLALVLSLNLVPTIALAEAPNQVGVWEGTLGKLPVAACFEPKGGGKYYYVNHGEDLKLEASAKNPQEWAEIADPDGDAKPTGTWTVQSVTDTTLTGSWQDLAGAKTLPVKLQRRPLSDEGTATACESAAYRRPHFNHLPKKYGAPFTSGGHRFRPLTVYPKVELVELLDQTPALSPLRNALDRHRDSIIAAREDCMKSGPHAEYSLISSVGYANATWITLRDRGGYECGGAYPDGISDALTLEVATGKTVDLHQWLDKSEKKQAELMRKVHAGYPGSAECAEGLKTWPGWHIWPTQQGLVFEPDLPHVARACTEDITLPYAQVEPYLNSVGRRAVRNITGKTAEAPSATPAPKTKAPRNAPLKRSPKK